MSMQQQNEELNVQKSDEHVENRELPSVPDVMRLMSSGSSTETMATAQGQMQSEEGNGQPSYGGDVWQVDHFNYTCPDIGLHNDNSMMNLTRERETEELQQSISVANGTNNYLKVSDTCMLTDAEREVLIKKKRRMDSYKTAMCNEHRRTGNCSYGANCKFAHSVEELRLPANLRGHANPKYKTVLCARFAKTGYCHYGGRCQFIHKIANPAVLQAHNQMLANVLSSSSAATSAYPQLKSSPSLPLTAHYPMAPPTISHLAAQLKNVHMASHKFDLPLPLSSSAPLPAYVAPISAPVLPSHYPTIVKPSTKRNLFNQTQPLMELNTHEDVYRAASRVAAVNSPSVERMAALVADCLPLSQANSFFDPSAVSASVSTDFATWGSFRAQHPPTTVDHNNNGLSTQHMRGQ